MDVAREVLRLRRRGQSPRGGRRWAAYTSGVTLGETLLSLAVALVAGGLIGAEREQAHRGQSDFGGVRTFPLIAMLGALGAILGKSLGGWVLGGFLLAASAMLILSRTRSKDDDQGITSEIAAIVTFALGALAGAAELLPRDPRLLLVIGLAVVTMALLAVKRPLHGFIASISRDDIYATAKFGILAVVALPLLPNRTFGPLGVINPFKIGVFIVLVAAVSFAGYVAARLVGSGRGLLLVALIGGLVSSTAVTVTLSGRAKGHPSLASICALAIVAACSTMFVRVLVMIGIVDYLLLAKLAAPLGLMAVTGFGVALVSYLRLSGKTKSADAVPFRNPFELRSALKFGLLYAVILVVAKAAEIYAGQTGLYASSVLAGLADVDAIALSITELHQSGMSSTVAARCIVLAVFTNTLVKAVIAASVGGRSLGARVGAGVLGVLVAGGVGLAVDGFVVGP
jgi:uncharacterized membrane protein (DUF4010 family)